MPHMANLSWIPLFLTFNISFIFFLSIFQTNSSKMFLAKKYNLTSNKKWPW